MAEDMDTEQNRPPEAKEDAPMEIHKPKPIEKSGLAKEASYGR